MLTQSWMIYSYFYILTFNQQNNSKLTFDIWMHAKHVSLEAKPFPLGLAYTLIRHERHLVYLISKSMCQIEQSHVKVWWPGGRFKNTYELLNQRALKFSYVNKIHIFQCMGKIFCVEFQRYPLKFPTKYLTHTLKDMIFMQFWNFKSS